VFRRDASIFIARISYGNVSVSGAPAGFQARVGKIRRKAPKNFFSFAHPGFQFAHPAIRKGCPPCPPDLREKASLATNQEGLLPSPPLPSSPPDLALQLGLVIHTPGL